MKKLILLLAAIVIALPLSAQFKAKMLFNSMGEDRIFMIYSSTEGYRYEFKEDGNEGVVIVKMASPDVIILMPEQKMAMKSAASSPMNLANDPIGSYEQLKKEGTLKEIGKETINGIECIKSELWSVAGDKYGQKSQKLFTIWTSDKYNFPMKMINHIDVTGELTMEMKDVEPWAPESTSFSIPDGYQVMNMGTMVPKH